MDKSDILLWIVGGGFGLMLVMWYQIQKQFEKVDQRFERFDQRFDKLEEKITDIDRRLCRLEGAFASKDCCVIKDDRHLKKAE